MALIKIAGQEFILLLFPLCNVYVMICSEALPCLNYAYCRLVFQLQLLTLAASSGCAVSFLLLLGAPGLLLLISLYVSVLIPLILVLLYLCGPCVLLVTASSRIACSVHPCCVHLQLSILVLHAAVQLSSPHLHLPSGTLPCQSMGIRSRGSPSLQETCICQAPPPPPPCSSTQGKQEQGRSSFHGPP